MSKVIFRDILFYDVFLVVEYLKTQETEIRIIKEESIDEFPIYPVYLILLYILVFTRLFLAHLHS